MLNLTTEQKARLYDTFSLSILTKADSIVADAKYDRQYDNTATTPTNALDEWLDGLDNLLSGRQYGAEKAYDIIESIVAESYPNIYQKRPISSLPHRNPLRIGRENKKESSPLGGEGQSEGALEKI